jgi:hypothetical protein
MINIVQDTKFLLHASHIGVDIETQTSPRPGQPGAGLTTSFGLSYNADILAISLYADGKSVVWLDVDKMSEKEFAKLGAFLKKALARKVTLIGHNILFDLRHIGGHFGFELPPETMVWDTMVMTRKLLLIDEPSSKFYKFGLLPTGLKWKLVSPKENEFLSYMKSQRGNLSDFADLPAEDEEVVVEEKPKKKQNYNFTAEEILKQFPNWDLSTDEKLEAAQQEFHEYIVALSLASKELEKPPSFRNLPANHAVWDMVGGFNPLHMDEAAKKALEIYVAYDAVLSYRIYEKQKAFADAVSSCGPKGTVAPMPNVNVPYWKELPGLLIDWQEQMGMQANLAIRGVAINLNYLAKRIDETREHALDLAPKLLFEPNPTDPYPEFRDVLSQMIWYEMTMDAVRDGKPYSDPKLWVNWKYIKLAPQMVADAIVTEDRELAMSWALWLTSLDPNTTRSKVLKSAPDARIAPKLDLKLFIQQQCFDDTDVGKYKAFITWRWYNYYYKHSKNVDPIDWVSKDHFKPFFVFVVAGWPLYTSEDFKYELSLGTKKFQERRNELERSSTPFDLQKLAIEMDAYSCSKPAMEWIFSQLEDTEGNPRLNLPAEFTTAAPKLHLYMDLISTWALHRRMSEYWEHAQKDGRIHTLLVPGTSTGRDSSTLPNLQNIKMRDFKGVFVGSEGAELVEIDASGAELRMQAMRAEDDNYAFEVMAGDLHTKMMEMYWPELVAHLRSIGDYAGVKDLRNLGKKATFAGNYGAGPKKQAFLIRADAEAAYKILDRNKALFPKVHAKKAELENNSILRVNRGELPAFTRLWRGERCMVDSYQGRLQGYTVWNYQLQGGVASFVHLAMTKIEHYLKTKGYKSRLLLSIHDSIIVEVAHEDYGTNMLQDIIAIFCGQVPASLLERTIPHIDFAAEYCPSNRKKWGYRVDREYPFPVDEFVNRWGRFKLADYLTEKEKQKPMSDWAAPTWVGPVHEGWNLEDAMAQAKEQRANKERLMREDRVAEVVRPPAPTFDANNWLEEFSSRAQHLLTPTTIQTTTVTTPVISLEQQFQVMQELKARGHGDLLAEQLAALEEMRDWLQNKANDIDKFIKDNNDPSAVAVTA